MCGIAGIIRPGAAQVDEREIRCMTDALQHRGPDGSGLLVRGPVAIGHRRLAIIDPAGGQQPLSNEDGTVWITFNGEVYNHRELRQQLESLGHRFATRCDTEVVVHAYEQWGQACLRRLRGMFALAIVDVGRRAVLLARDPVGIKPLCYRVGKDYVAFASELAALRQVDDATPQGDPRAIDLFLRFQYIPAPHTIYRDIFKLPPAHRLWIGFDGRIDPPQRYWDVRFEPQRSISEAQWIDQVEQAVTRSVEAHLMADVPVGVLLSGGVDSTLIAAIARRLSSGPMPAFTIGFAEQDYSELAFAQEAARRLGLELHHQIATESALGELDDWLERYGEPFGDNSALATWQLSRLAGQQVKVVLSGDGGDEVFGGYASYLQWLDRASFHKGYEYFRAWPRLGLQWMWGAARRRWLPVGQDRLGDWLACITHTPQDLRARLWRPRWHGLLDEPCWAYDQAAQRAKRLGRLDFAQYLDLHTYLPGDILTKVDIASMAFGLEVRPPLLDVELIELAARMPASLRVTRDRDGRYVGKRVLKRVLEREFPHAFVHRRKQGFASPVTPWMTPGRAGRRLLEAMLADPACRLGEFFRIEAIRDLLAAHGPQQNHAGRLWLLLVLGRWLQRHPEVRFDADDAADQPRALAPAA